MITEAEARALMPPEQVKEAWDAAKAEGLDAQAAIDRISQATYVKKPYVRAWLAFLGVDVGGDIRMHSRFIKPGGRQ